MYLGLDSQKFMFKLKYSLSNYSQLDWFELLPKLQNKHQLKIL